MANTASSGDGLSVVTLAAAMNYTKKTTEGMGAIQGKPGKDGKDGKSAYQIAVDAGFVGTEQQWIDSLRGLPGKDGNTPYIGGNGNWWIGDIDTEVNASGGGFSDHRQLTHRNDPEQHEISAINNLENELSKKFDKDTDVLSILDIIEIMGD